MLQNERPADVFWGSRAGSQAGSPGCQGSQLTPPLGAAASAFAGCVIGPAATEVNFLAACSTRCYTPQTAHKRRPPNALSLQTSEPLLRQRRTIGGGDITGLRLQ